MNAVDSEGIEPSDATPDADRDLRRSSFRSGAKCGAEDFQIFNEADLLAALLSLPLVDRSRLATAMMKADDRSFKSER
jgi:hypothetical protein